MNLGALDQGDLEVSPEVMSANHRFSVFGFNNCGVGRSEVDLNTETEYPGLAEELLDRIRGIVIYGLPSVLDDLSIWRFQWDHGHIWPGFWHGKMLRVSVDKISSTCVPAISDEVCLTDCF